MKAIRQLLKGVLDQVAPRIMWRRRIARWDIFEAEELLLPRLCNRKKISIDVGAAGGSYTARMLLDSARVVAFEPLPLEARALRSMFSSTSLVTVEEIALSNEQRRAKLYSPAENGLSTIEPKNSRALSAAAESNEVECKCLDQYRLHPVGFIKIDVEGHELAVLEGAVQTIQQERPVMLIEIEKRHNPGSFAGVTSFLLARGYAGCFLLAGKIVDIAAFDPSVHQNSKDEDVIRDQIAGRYINNFLFLPQSEISHIASSYRS